LRNPSELEMISQGLFRENQLARRLLATKDKAKSQTWQIYRLRRIRDSWDHGQYYRRPANVNANITSTQIKVKLRT
jgi:hypothetical protein